MEKTQLSLTGFDGQVITDYFQSLVLSKTINKLDSIKAKKDKDSEIFEWGLVIKKRWNYLCKVVILPITTEYVTPEIISSSRRCSITLHGSESLTVLLSNFRSLMNAVINGAQAENYVMDIVNNHLLLNGKATLHCLPASTKDDVNGIDCYLYFKMTPSSKVVKIPLQIKYARDYSDCVRKHMEKFPTIPVVFTRNSIDNIKKQILDVVNTHLNSCE